MLFAVDELRCSPFCDSGAITGNLGRVGDFLPF